MKKVVKLLGDMTAAMLEAIGAAVFTAVFTLVFAGWLALYEPAVWEALGFAKYEFGIETIWPWLSSFPAVHLILIVTGITFLKRMISASAAEPRQDLKI